MAIQVMQLKIVFDCKIHAFYYNSYWMGNVVSTTDPAELGRNLLGKLTDFDNYLPRLMNCLTTRVAIRSLKYQFIYPNRLWSVDESIFFFGAFGTILSGNQSWSSNTRINWFTSPASSYPHWSQIGPVPKFGVFPAIDPTEYLTRVNALAEYVKTPFVTIDGDQWVGACLLGDGGFAPVVGYSVAPLRGRQKTRRRVL